MFKYKDRFKIYLKTDVFHENKNQIYLCFITGSNTDFVIIICLCFSSDL